MEVVSHLEAVFNSGAVLAGSGGPRAKSWKKSWAKTPPPAGKVNGQVRLTAGGLHNHLIRLAISWVGNVVARGPLKSPMGLVRKRPVFRRELLVSGSVNCNMKN